MQFHATHYAANLPEAKVAVRRVKVSLKPKTSLTAKDLEMIKALDHPSLSAEAMEKRWSKSGASR